MKHAGPISGIASSDRYIATAGYDSNLILWDKKSGIPITIFSHDHLVNQCEFSPCGRFLVSASSDHSARVWSLSDLRLLDVLANDADDIEHATFSPDSQFIATGSLSGHLTIYHLETGRIQSTRAHDPYVKSVAWSRDGRYVVTCGEDGTVKKWDSSNLENCEVIANHENHADTIITLNDNLYCTGNDFGEIWLLGRVKKSYSAHKSGVKRLCYDETSRQIISTSYDNQAILWSLSDDALVRQTEFEIPAVVWPRSCTFIEQNKLAFGAFGSAYAIYNLRAKAWDLVNVGTVPSVNTLAIYNDHVFTVGDSGLVKEDGNDVCKVPSLCNFISVTEHGSFVGGHSGEIFDIRASTVIYKNNCPLNSAVTLNIDSHPYLVAADYNGNLIWVNLKTAEFRKQKLFDNAIKKVAYRRGVIIAVCATGDVAVVNLNNYEVPTFYPGSHSEVANDISFIDDDRFCTVGRDKRLILWHRGKHESINSPHRSSIKSVAASEKYICTGSYTGEIYIYNLDTGEWSPAQRPTRWGISSIHYSDERNTFFLGSYDGNVYQIQMGRL